MLQEWQGANRQDRDGNRRWFTDEEMDLIVWYRGSTVSDFQLCYDKTGDQHAIVWSDEGLLRHQRVDAGNERPGSPKSSPVMTESARRSVGELATEFRQRTSRVDPALVSLVVEKIDLLREKKSDGR